MNRKETIKAILRFSPHIVLLLVLAVAEGFRLTEFYRMLTGSYGSAIASAALTVGIVTYLALYHLDRASTFAMLMCILLSAGSFVEPWQDLRRSKTEAELAKANAEKLPLPVWDERKYWFGGGETYRKAFEAELKRVQAHNERVEQMLFSEEEKEIDYYKYLIFALGILVMAVCVPFLAWLVSHRLAREIDEYRRKTAIPSPRYVTAGTSYMNRQAQTKGGKNK